MKRTSDHSPPILKRITATEARRTFSKVLDRIEQGMRFVVRRRGRDACIMEPALVSGRRASECLARLLGRSDVLLDDRFGADLLDVVQAEELEEPRQHRADR